MVRLSHFLILLAAWSPPAMAVPWHVSVDVTGLTDFELELALFDNSGTIGDTWALIDDVKLGGVVIENFEDGTLGGFDDSLNPGSVTAVTGSLIESGSYVMRIDEDPTFNPTFTFRDILGSSETLLEFDFEFFGSTLPGFFGLDELVVSILDPVTLNPLLPGLTAGLGDVLAVNADGVSHTSAVGANAVPVPGSTLLAVVGLGWIWATRRSRKSHTA